MSNILSIIFDLRLPALLLATFFHRNLIERSLLAILATATAGIGGIFRTVGRHRRICRLCLDAVLRPYQIKRAISRPVGLAL